MSCLRFFAKPDEARAAVNAPSTPNISDRKADRTMRMLIFTM